MKFAPYFAPYYPEYFWSFVDKNGPRPSGSYNLDCCWTWKGAFTIGGYGRASVGKVRTTAHRIAFALANGEIPEGMFVLHKCDNPSCVNPSHLRTGTPAENSNDMVMRGRTVKSAPWATGDNHYMRRCPEKKPRGEHNSNAQATELQIKEAFALAEQGLSGLAIAKRLRLGKQGIYGALTGRSWKYLNLKLSDEAKIRFKTFRGRLSEQDVEKVWALSISGLNQGEIAKRMKVCRGTIGNVLTGKTWDYMFAKHSHPKISANPV